MAQEARLDASLARGQARRAATSPAKMSFSEKNARIVSLDRLPQGWRNGVVAIGNFDGMHLGHQAVLAAAREEAERRGVACYVLTFEPHPRAFFSGRPLFRLTPVPLKAAAAAALGLDGTLVMPFDQALAEHSAEAFVREILVERLAIGAAVTGHDFHFGKERRGTPLYLREAGARHGFAVTIIDAYVAGSEPISSTRIRSALAAGDVTMATTLLGWHWAVAGTIVHGDARGRDLGYPTANMALDAATELAHGIYAVRYLRPDGSLRAGVASFGRRPTFDDGAPLFETFLFDFAGDLYGEMALVGLFGFIRQEKRFDSVAELVACMDQDSIDARALLERQPANALDRGLNDAWAAFARSERRP
jgi:riboflavin kinase/FMN adenylyltransferase